MSRVFKDIFPPLTLGLLGIIAAWVFVPRGMPSPVYLDYAHTLLNGEKLTDRFMPTGYPALLALGISLAGDSYGIFLTQAGAYGLTVLLAWMVLRYGGLTPAAAFLGTALIAFHPYMILNINRITYNSVAPPFFMLAIFVLWFPSRFNGRFWTFLCGATLGALLVIRPNILTVMPIVFGALTLWAPWRVPIVLATAMTLGFIALSLAATGQIFAWPTNGSYNLFGGFNAYTEAALWEHMHVEPSIGKALGALSIPHGPNEVSPEIFNALAWNFITEHPVDVIRGFFVKALTLFRPDYRTSTGWAKLAVQTILVIPVLFWFMVMLRRRCDDGLGRGRRTALFAAFYLLPFVILNADPRYRYLFDLVVLLHLTMMLERWVNGPVVTHQSNQFPKSVKI